MALLPDGKTIVAVIRLDGGDGCLGGNTDEPQHYLEYRITRSTDWGFTWKPLEVLEGTGCVRPRLLVFGSQILLSGGRHRTKNTSDVILWLDQNGTAQSFLPYSLSSAHNLGVSKGTKLPRFTSVVNQSCGPWTMPRETNAYTSIVFFGKVGLGAVFYDLRRRQPASSTNGVTRSSQAMSTQTWTFILPFQLLEQVQRVQLR